MKIVINNVFQLIQILIAVRVLLSWISHDPYNHYISSLYNFTDIILRPIRDILPLQNAPFDISPIIAFFLIDIIRNILLNLF